MDILTHLIETGCTTNYGTIKPEKMQTVIDTLKQNGYREHHRASAKGYMSRKIIGVIDIYNGHFGQGYTIETPRIDTTNYHTIIYFVKEN